MATIETKIEGGKLTISVTGQAPIVIDPNTFTTEVRNSAMLHGFKQKIGDAAALSRDPKSGASATPSMKYHAMMDVVNQLDAGDWNKRAEGDGANNRGLLVEALMRLSGKPEDETAAFVKGLDDAEQASMRAEAQIAPIIAQIKAERAAKRPAKVPSVDVTSKLGAFFGKPKDADPPTEPTAPVEPPAEEVAAIKSALKGAGHGKK